MNKRDPRVWVIYTIADYRPHLYLYWTGKQWSQGSENAKRYSSRMKALEEKEWGELGEWREIVLDTSRGNDDTP